MTNPMQLTVLYSLLKKETGVYKECVEFLNMETGVYKEHVIGFKSGNRSL